MGVLLHPFYRWENWAQRGQSHRASQQEEPGLQPREARNRGVPSNFYITVWSLRLRGHLPSVFQFLSDRTSDFKLRLILTIFKDRNPKFDEKSNVQKGVMVLGCGSISEKWKLPGHLPPCPEIKGMDSHLIIPPLLSHSSCREATHICIFSRFLLKGHAWGRGSRCLRKVLRGRHWKHIPGTQQSGMINLV